VPRIPSTLVEAIAELRDSLVALEAFGADVHHHLLNTAEQEWLASNRHVSDWELARNFERMGGGGRPPSFPDVPGSLTLTTGNRCGPVRGGCAPCSAPRDSPSHLVAP